MLLEKLGYEANDTVGGTNAAYTNLNGHFALSSINANQVIIEAASLLESGLDNYVLITVTGTSPDDITTEVSTEEIQ